MCIVCELGLWEQSFHCGTWWVAGLCSPVWCLLPMLAVAPNPYALSYSLQTFCVKSLMPCKYWNSPESLSESPWIGFYVFFDSLRHWPLSLFPLPFVNFCLVSDLDCSFLGPCSVLCSSLFLQHYGFLLLGFHSCLPVPLDPWFFLLLLLSSYIWAS
jgi:hypothetical protein